MTIHDEIKSIALDFACKHGAQEIFFEAIFHPGADDPHALRRIPRDFDCQSYTVMPDGDNIIFMRYIFRPKA